MCFLFFIIKACVVLKLFLHLYICICMYCIVFAEVGCDNGNISDPRQRHCSCVYTPCSRLFLSSGYLDISSSSIYLFINILKLICLLCICYLLVYKYRKTDLFVRYLFITILNLFVYKYLKTYLLLKLQLRK